MNFETKTVNYVNETSLGKDLSENKIEEAIDWKDFWKMAKDTSGGQKTLKAFEDKYSSVMDRPHIANAIKKADDFNSFMKAIKKFEK